MSYSFVEISPFSVIPEETRPRLTDNINAEVAIIGGGYTGLSTALNLRAAGIDVVILEKDFCGSGASGRNAGHLTPTIGKDLPSLVMFYGREGAGRLVRFADDAVTYTEGLIRQLDIDCGYADTGNIIAGIHPKHERRMRKAVAAAEKVGAHQRFVETGEMRSRGLPAAFLFGILESKGGTLDPGRYATGLRSAVIAAGARVFENTPALQVETGRRVIVRAPSGTVKADSLVLATNGYTANTAPKIRGLRRKCIPLLDCMFETEPLTADQMAAIGWAGREGIYTSHEILESYRLTSRDTITGGSKFVRYRWNLQLAQGLAPRSFEIITRGFRQRFPELAGLNIRTYWSGWLGFTPNFLPACGRTGRHDNIYYGLGYCGHGMAQATYMGEMLSALIRGNHHPGHDVLRHRSLPVPPEPLLWMAANGLITVLYRMDCRTDKQITAR